MSTLIIVLAIIFIILAVCFIFGWLPEKIRWNNGICKKNGLPWKIYGYDSGGARGYYAGDQTCWISYPGIDEEKETER